ncbi:hypothetical protein J6590_048977 [Homalodisca vitripennis]|nr:hypothetical protein J6590_048977 [Homalodisca vitripennis]
MAPLCTFRKLGPCQACWGEYLAGEEPVIGVGRLQSAWASTTTLQPPVSSLTPPPPLSLSLQSRDVVPAHCSVRGVIYRQYIILCNSLLDWQLDIYVVLNKRCDAKDFGRVSFTAA